ncbi:MAG: AraC family transcriptional regulator [Butyricicoccus porcorum]
MEIIRHLQIPGVNLFFRALEHQTVHIHAELELLWIVNGELTVCSRGRKWVAEQDSILLFHSMEPHELHSRNGACTVLCIQMLPSFLGHVFSSIGQICFDFPQGIPFGEKQGKQFREKLVRAADLYLHKTLGHELGCSGLLYLAVQQLLTDIPWHIQTKNEISEQKRIGDRLERLMEYVEQNYMHRIRLSDFAQQEDLSVGYLSHFVKKNFQQSFQEYVDSVRFQKACRMIEMGGLRLLDISEESGFSDYRYFSRAFVRRTGKTPEEYRSELEKQSGYQEHMDELALYEHYFGDSHRGKESLFL